MNLSMCPIRRSNITATEMAALLGANKYSSPAKVAENKTNPVVLEGNHLRRGKLKEPSVLEAFLLDMNLHTRRHVGPTVKLEGTRIAATPDAYYEGHNVVVECKSIMSRNFDKWYIEVPEYYQVQVMVQCLVMGSDYGIIGALEEGNPDECEYDFVAWKILRDSRIEELMVQETARFFEAFDRGETIRVNSKVKAEVLAKLPSLRERIYPLVKPERRDRQDEDLSAVLALFK